MTLKLLIPNFPLHRQNRRMSRMECSTDDNSESDAASGCHDDKFSKYVVYLERVVKLSNLLLKGPASPEFSWLQDVTEVLKNVPDTPANLTFGFRPGGRGHHSASSNSLHQLLTLLRDAMLHLRYEECAEILKSIVSGCRVLMPLALEIVIHRSEMEILYNLPDLPQTLGSDVVEQLKHLDIAINSQQLTVEQFIHKLTFQGVDEAMECVFNIPKVKVQLANSSHSKQVALFYRAFKGLAHYLKWEKTQTSSQSQSIHQFNQNMQSEQHAEDALSEFSSVTSQPGDWDMFISNQVQLLQFFGRHGEALAILKSYRKRNEDNPRSYHYLLEYYQSQGDSANHLALLTEYCVKWPSDKTYCLQLSDSLLASDNPDQSTSVRLLFNLLDYSCHRQDLELWEKFKNFLSSAIAKDDSTRRCICEEWRRRDWWLPFHFSSKQAVPNILTIKNDVLELLKNTENRNESCIL